MNLKNLQIEPIHRAGDLETETYGFRAERLRRMFNIGLPVPNGFCIPALAIDECLQNPNEKISYQLKNLKGLYAVRSSPSNSDLSGVGAILNLGMNDASLPVLASRIGTIGALDIYSRFINSFSTLVFGLDSSIFENFVSDSLLDKDTLAANIEASKDQFHRETGIHFPQELEDQIDLTFSSFARAWHRPSAIMLRKARGATENASLGMVLQEMVIGIGPDISGWGQIKTINSDSGERALTGYFLPNSQGKEVPSGELVPHMLSECQRTSEVQSLQSLETINKNTFNDIEKFVKKASIKFGEALNFEFTLQRNKVYFLDASIAERSPRADIRVAVDLVELGAITEEAALLKVDPHNLVEFLHPQISSDFSRDVFGTGLPASPGAVSGKIVFSSQAASKIKSKEESAILVRLETSPEDIAGIHDSVGVLTGRGGMTSHAAVIARGLGLPCVVGVNSLTMNISEKTLITGDGRKFVEGDIITLDGTSGEVIVGSAKMIQPQISGAFSKLMKWADKYRTIGVRGNADAPQEAQLAKNFGADGIGLCRTEHMFFEKEKLLVMREMILADDEQNRLVALKKLLPMQRDDFIKFFQIMNGKPVTIRLLDPPLHEFLPHSEEELSIISNAMNLPLAEIRERTNKIQEFNPMLGKRGVRLGVTMPEIYEMQVQAIFEATAIVNRDQGKAIVPEIMIPLISAIREVDLIKSKIIKICRTMEENFSCKIDYKLGVVVETPRAALRAEDLSKSCDFLSFGTNDLTQMTYGLSRDDAGRFMRTYLEKEVFPKDPFHSLDFEGVGELILLATKRARKAKPKVELGLCGEHGGDPSSIEFCKSVNFDYVSCSPYRIPIARLAAAQVSIAWENTNRTKRKPFKS